jgi:hypothetical protein
MKLRFPPTRYRVVRDRYLGFTAEYRPWWSPFWTECDLEFKSTNTSDTLEKARAVCANHAKHRRQHPAGQVVARFSARELEAQQ